MSTKANIVLLIKCVQAIEGFCGALKTMVLTQPHIVQDFLGSPPAVHIPIISSVIQNWHLSSVTESKFHVLKAVLTNAYHPNAYTDFEMWFIS